MNPFASHTPGRMDELPKTHELTKEEVAFVKSLDKKHQELHDIAVEWLQTSYRPEWSHMFQKGTK